MKYYHIIETDKGLKIVISKKTSDPNIKSIAVYSKKKLANDYLKFGESPLKHYGDPNQ